MTSHDATTGSNGSTGGDELTEVIAFLDEISAGIETLSARLDALEKPHLPWPQPSEDLADWVTDWLIPTFRLDTVLQGWQHTPAIHSELAALHAGYQEMTAPKATGWDALAWHQHRASTVERIGLYRQQHMNQTTTGWSE